MICHIERADIPPNLEQDPTVHVMHCGMRMLSFEHDDGDDGLLPLGHDFYLEGYGDEKANCAACIALKGARSVETREEVDS